MAPDSTLRSSDSGAGQQRFLSLFLRSEREVFRCVAALVPNVTDAEDIVQQTAMALWEKFDADDPALPFTPWACRFALNKAGQWIERRQDLQPEFELRLQHLEGCLRKLPRGHRSLVEGDYYERVDIETLAEQSGRSPAATHKMLQRIRHILQLCVENQARPEVA